MGVSVLRGQGVGLPTVKVSFWPGVRRSATPFAFWYEDDPLGGCIRFPTERECERMLGLPDGWTQYGADGGVIRSAQRYRALGNAIALPCADYIMAGIAEALAGPEWKEADHGKATGESSQR